MQVLIACQSWVVNRGMRGEGCQRKGCRKTHPQATPRNMIFVVQTAGEVSGRIRSPLPPMKPPLLPRGVTAVLLSAGLAPSLHAASNLEITVHAKAAPIGEFTGTVASGSGAAYGVGD